MFAVDDQVRHKCLVTRASYSADGYLAEHAQAGNLHYQSVTFGTFGSFGTRTWSVITKACDPASHPKAIDDYNPWNSPGPKRDFTLSLGFALQRANFRMLRNADKRRRLARSSGKYSSGTRPTSSDEDY